MSWIKIFCASILMLAAFLLTTEIGLRILSTAKSCFFEICNFNPVSNFVIRDPSILERSMLVGISQYDAELGYIPNKGFDQEIASWKNARVTINPDGFRSNGSGTDSDSSDILAVGDSFTFGDQVSNQDTWPACLEQKLRRSVHNGGVFGYGAAQAIRRAQIETEKRPYSTVILSIFLYDDFNRDQLRFRSGFPKPSVIRAEDEVLFSTVPDRWRCGTKFNPAGQKTILGFFYLRSLVLAALVDRYFPNINFSGDLLDELHPDTAKLDEIISWSLQEFENLRVGKKTGPSIF